MFLRQRTMMGCNKFFTNFFCQIFGQPLTQTSVIDKNQSGFVFSYHFTKPLINLCPLFVRHESAQRRLRNFYGDFELPFMPQINNFRVFTMQNEIPHGFDWFLSRRNGNSLRSLITKCFQPLQ